MSVWCVCFYICKYGEDKVIRRPISSDKGHEALHWEYESKQSVVNNCLNDFLQLFDLVLAWKFD